MLVRRLEEKAPGRVEKIKPAFTSAAINISAGHAVTTRGGDGITQPVNREPQLLLHSV